MLSADAHAAAAASLLLAIQVLGGAVPYFSCPVLAHFGVLWCSNVDLCGAVCVSVFVCLLLSVLGAVCVSSLAAVWLLYDAIKWWLLSAKVRRWFSVQVLSV